VIYTLFLSQLLLRCLEAVSGSCPGDFISGFTLHEVTHWRRTFSDVFPSFTYCSITIHYRLLSLLSLDIEFSLCAAHFLFTILIGIWTLQLTSIIYFFSNLIHCFSFYVQYLLSSFLYMFQASQAHHQEV